jgi:hypothetical protein
MGMNSKTRNILRGMGSILDIMPERRAPSRFVPMTPGQINAKAWEMVGDSFRMAIGKVQRESPIKPTKG